MVKILRVYDNFILIYKFSKDFFFEITNISKYNIKLRNFNNDITKSKVTVFN